MIHQFSSILGDLSDVFLDARGRIGEENEKKALPFSLKKKGEKGRSSFHYSSQKFTRLTLLHRLP